MTAETNQFLLNIQEEARKQAIEELKQELFSKQDFDSLQKLNQMIKEDFQE